MLNTNKLKGKIVEKGFSVEELANKMGINKSTLYRKINNESYNLSIKEADKIVETLDLNLEEANAIFFSQFVA